MRHLRSLVALSVTAALLAGCAAAPAGDEAAGEPSSPPASSSPSAPSESDVKADSWLEGAVVPPGAERSETAPRATPPFDHSYYAWPCSPMEERTGYWTIAGADVAETANWLQQHPTADLIVPVAIPIPEDTEVDSATVGNVPERDALEGISYTVSRTEDGVAIRAEIGVFTPTTVCPTLEPGASFGGPGQG